MRVSGDMPCDMDDAPLPAGAGAGTGMSGIAEFESIEELLERLDPSYSVFCIWPETLTARARQFVRGFPGRCLYAVKCNPHPVVLDALYRGGVRHFDTASLNEISAVAERFDDARCHFNHPVKIRAHVQGACKLHGVNDFVVDHPKELQKLLDIVDEDAVIQVRLLVPSEHAAYRFTEKFGAPAEEAVKLLRAVEASGRRPAVSFHVGSQCVDAIAYAKALELTGEVIRRAGVAPAYVNVGGGFPSWYRQDVPSLEDCFRVIEENAAAALGGNIELLCEPGRALVADGCGLIAQVQHRADDCLHINDGIYGCMFECSARSTLAPARALGRGRGLRGDMRPFRLFGPTCDPMDQFPHPFALPDDIDEGDWIEFGVLGAYSTALATRFNGFGMDAIVSLGGHATYAWNDDKSPPGRAPLPNSEASAAPNGTGETYRGHLSQQALSAKPL